MTDPHELSLTWSEPEPGVAAVAVVGDLAYENADSLTTAVDARLRDEHPPRELRIGCGGIGHCDSYGLAALLMVRRRCAAAGSTLRLDDRGPALDRLLRVTRTLEHLTGGAGGAREERSDS